MREVNINELLCYRKLICGILEIADEDIKSEPKFKCDYKQAEAENVKCDAFRWVFDEGDYRLRFEDLCAALGLEIEPIKSLYEKKRISNLDMRSMRQQAREQES